MRRLQQETGTGLNGTSEKLLRLARGISLALPVASALFLVSCTSTGTNLDVSGTSLQAAVPQPSLSSQIPDPAEPGAQAGNEVAQSQNAPIKPTTLALNGSPQVDLAVKADIAAQETAKLNDLPVPTEPNLPISPAPLIALNQPEPTVTGINAPPAAGSNEALIAKAASAAKSNEAQTSLAAVNPARFGEEEKPSSGATRTDGQILTAAPQILTAAPPAKKKGLFSSLFATQPKNANAGQTEAATGEGDQVQLALADPTPTKASSTPVSVKPVLQPAKLQLANLETQQETVTDIPAADNGDLPGVRKGALFEIKRRDSLDSDADVDIGETDGGPVLLASAAGLARLAPNGLKVQRESVDVACIKPQLVKMLKSIENHYGRPVVVTSGYRSPGYNRRVRGAKNSLHMFCAAVDIQVSGVGKWELARYARSMTGRGGVGTYCHTESVHVDVGPDRDWNWRCSRRK